MTEQPSVPNIRDRGAVLIDPADLEAARAERHVVVLDIRFRQDNAYDPRAAYLAGHVPGAVAVDFVHELTGPPHGFSGKRPLPPIERLQHDARRWGIEQDSLVVLCDDNANRQAARAWWTLLWAGLVDVRLLDGGLAGWTGAGGATEQGLPFPARGSVTLASGSADEIDADGAAELARTGVLIDARDDASFAAGHIPGAVNIPTGGNLDAAGCFAGADALRHRFEAHGVDGSRPVGVYCGGGVAASHQIAALTLAGIPAALFPGSWSAWSSDPARPKATGA